MKIPVWLNTQPVAPAWLSGERAAYTLRSARVSIAVHVCPDSMYVQNVKTGSLFISQRSCLFSYIDASGAWPNKVDSSLNCLPTLSLIGKGPRSVCFSRN